MTHDNTNTQTFRKTSTYAMVVTALMAAVTCILAPLSVPIGPVPISLTNFAIYLSLYLLDWKKGTLSYLIYLLLGLVGLPVFSGFTGGLAKLAGPTGGYIIGFIPMAIIAGIVIDKFTNRGIQILGMIVGTAICYALLPVRLYSRRSTCSLCHSFHSCGSVQNGHRNDYRTDGSQKTWNCSTAIITPDDFIKAYR